MPTLLFPAKFRRLNSDMSSAEVTSRVSSAEEKRKLRRQTKGEWEVMPGLKEGEKYAEKVIKFDGYLHKKRNPPLKGWHRVSGICLQYTETVCHVA